MERPPSGAHRRMRRLPDQGWAHGGGRSEDTGRGGHAKGNGTHWRPCSKISKDMALGSSSRGVVRRHQAPTRYLARAKGDVVSGTSRALRGRRAGDLTRAEGEVAPGPQAKEPRHRMGRRGGGGGCGEIGQLDNVDEERAPK